MGRLILSVATCGLLLTAYASHDSKRPSLSPIRTLAPSIFATSLAVIARALELDDVLAMTLPLASILPAQTAVIALLVWGAESRLDTRHTQIAASLQGNTRRLSAAGITETVPIEAVHPGEVIIVQAGERVLADGTISGGQAVVEPWFDADWSIPAHEGQHLVAGSKVIHGDIRLTVAWTETDRAWMRLSHDPLRRVETSGRLTLFSRLCATHGALGLAGLVGLVGIATGQATWTTLLLSLTAYAAFGHLGLGQLGGLLQAQCVLHALKRGICYRTCDALDRSSRISRVALCARSALLMGTPEVTSISPVGSYSVDEVLALTAGAEQAANSPTHEAISQAAHRRHVKPETLRSLNVQPGLGMTGLTPSGERVIVGSRALMLAERVGIASVEQQLSKLETSGRSVLLTALGGRLIGVLGLQDRLRPGARSAVQHLLDASVEPILISSEARETCDALARTLDITHVRPELLPTEIGREIRQLLEGGAGIGAVGTSPDDDDALGAASVSIALSHQGSTTPEWDIHIVSGSVQDAGYGVQLARQMSTQMRNGVAWLLVPPLLAVLITNSGLAPPALTPILAALGTFIAWNNRRGDHYAEKPAHFEQ